MRALLHGLRTLLSRARFEREMDEELRLHIEHRAEDLMASGLSPDEARRQARLEFGTIESYKEHCRDESGFAAARPLHGLTADLRIAARRLAATPLFTIFAILSLAVGIGVTTAVYSIVDRIFWRDPGFTDPSTLAFIISHDGGDDGRYAVSLPDYEDFRLRQTSFSELTGIYVILPSVASPSITETYRGEAVEGNYFAMLGTTAAIGRLLQPADDTGRTPAVVLSHELWRTRFNADPEVIGRTVRLSGHPFEIVGVAPPSFHGPIPGVLGSSLWIPSSTVGPFRLNPSSTLPERDRTRYTVIGRLKPGVTAQQASAEARAFATALDAEYPKTVTRPGRPPGRGWRASTYAQLQKAGDDLGRFGVIIFGLVTLVLVVACTNLANLVLARGTTRQQEFAVRRALGAPRWRLIREQCAESLLLAIGGAALSWAVMAWLMRVLDRELPLTAGWTISMQPELNTTALLLSGAALLLSLLVFGLEPALALTKRSDVRQDLASTAGAVGIPRTKRQRRLLRWQVAISTSFFIIASLCVSSLVDEARHDSGVDMGRIGVAMLDFQIQRRDEITARAVMDRLLARISAEPGVESAAASTGLPFGTPITPRLWLYTDGKSSIEADGSEEATLICATSGFFRTAGISILRGRGFDDRDDSGAPAVVVLSEFTAKKLFGSTNIVGRQLQVRVDMQHRGVGSDQPSKPATIVGIAEDTDTTHYRNRGGDTAYVPLAQAYSPWITVVARAADPSVAIGAIRRAVREADPDLAVSGIGTGRERLAARYVFTQGAAIVALALGAVTLLLAMAGLYGVQSHLVAHRTREIGVRMSLGATASEVKQLVLRDGYKPVLQGLALGIFFGLVGRAIVRATLSARMDVVDPWMLFAVPVPLLLTAFFACYLPARRASRVDPNIALRHL